MVLFEETHKISEIWKLILMILLIICTVMFLWVDRDFIGGVILCGIFTVLFFMLKLNIKVYEDRLEYRLFPFHISSKVIMLNAIVGIDLLTPRQIGVYGFKIKNTPTGMLYYFGGGNMMRLRTSNSRNIIFGIRGVNEIQEVLKL